MFDGKEYIFQHIFQHRKIHLNWKRPKFNPISFFTFVSMGHIYMRMKDAEIFFD
jgi:hypothetical protein